MKQIALLDDDVIYLRRLEEQLAQRGFAVRAFTCPEAMLAAIDSLQPTAFIIDWYIPKLSGPLVLQRLRRTFGGQTPILVVTAAGSESTVLTAFSFGADDVVAKPVGCSVLIARIGAVQRRGRAEAAGEELVLGPVRLNVARHCAYIDDVEVALTPKEFELAHLLFANPQSFLSRKMLLATVWGVSDDSKASTLAQHISTLRRKLRLSDCGIRLNSVYGAGYRLDCVAAGAAGGGRQLVENTGAV